MALLAGLYTYFANKPKHEPVAGDAATQRHLIVASNPYPPYIYEGEDGNLTGFDVAVLEALFERLGRGYRIKMMAFDALIIALKQGKVDMTIGGMEITPPRRAQIEMLAYYVEPTATQTLFFWNKVPNGIVSLDDLFKKYKRPVITTLSGSTQENYLRGEYPEARIKPFGDIDHIVLDVRYGKSDVGLLDSSTMHKLAQRHPRLKRVVVDLPAAHRSLGLGIGIAKGNAELRDAVAAALEELEADGTLAALAATWLTTP